MKKPPVLKRLAGRGVAHVFYSMPGTLKMYSGCPSGPREVPAEDLVPQGGARVCKLCLLRYYGGPMGAIEEIAELQAALEAAIRQGDRA